MNIVICPDDPLMVDPTSPNAQQLLSYGVNDQFFVDYRGKPYNTATPPLGQAFNICRPRCLAVTQRFPI